MFPIFVDLGALRRRITSADGRESVWKTGLIVVVVALAMTPTGCSKVAPKEQSATRRGAIKVAETPLDNQEKKSGSAHARARGEATLDRAAANTLASEAATSRRNLATPDATPHSDKTKTGLGGDKEAATSAEATAPAMKHDKAALLSLAALASCKRVDHTRHCKPLAALERRCKTAWARRELAPRDYLKLWWTLHHVVVTAQHERVRFGAAYLATSNCRPRDAIVTNAAAGQALLDALRGEPKGSQAGPPMAEMLSAWWAGDHPRLHAGMGQLIHEKAHPAPTARAEFLRFSGRYSTKQPRVQSALIHVASDPDDSVLVRTQAIRQLPAMVGTASATDALVVLAEVATSPPGPLTIEAYGALGDAAAVTHWPRLVAFWRQNSGNPIVGAAMARATWRYAIAKYGNQSLSMPVRMGAFDTALVVLREETTPLKARLLAIRGLQFGGHTNAQVELERIAHEANGVDADLATAAQRALKHIKPVDPAFASLVEPKRRAGVARPPSSKRARPRARRRPRERVARPKRSGPTP